MRIRFEPTLTSGKAWRIDICTGNRRKGTFRAVQITDPVYTLAQAQAFCTNNSPRRYAAVLAVPDDFPVKQLVTDQQKRDAADPRTCGTCFRTWDDAVITGMTPAPSARCPFEYFHK